MHTRPDVHALELKVPPLVLVIIVALLMELAAAWVPGFNFHLASHSIVASVLAPLGVLTCTVGIREFKRARTTVNPTKPQSTSSLVRSGIYRHTRNPMYLGFLLILAGWATLTANILAFAFLPVFVLYMNRFQIQPEERALTAIFGHQYKTYCSAVRRWI